MHHDKSSAVRLRSSSWISPDAVLPRLFPRCSPPGLLTRAARGGLGPGPAPRSRGAFPHLPCSMACSSCLSAVERTFVAHRDPCTHVGSIRSPAPQTRSARATVEPNESGGCPGPSPSDRTPIRRCRRDHAAATEARRRESLENLARRPGCGRMLGHVDVRDLPTGV